MDVSQKVPMPQWGGLWLVIDRSVRASGRAAVKKALRTLEAENYIMFREDVAHWT